MSYEDSLSEAKRRQSWIDIFALCGLMTSCAILGTGIMLVAEHQHLSWVRVGRWYAEGMLAGFVFWLAFFCVISRLGKDTKRYYATILRDRARYYRPDELRKETSKFQGYAFAVLVWPVGLAFFCLEQFLKRQDVRSGWIEPSQVAK